MRIAYRFITTVFYYLLYPYLYFRILKKKECPLRYQEKLGVSLKVRNDGYLIWFHCSSIGELKSIFPIIDHYLKRNQILVTTSTLGSNEVFQKKYYNTNNIIHQYAPIDSPSFTGTVAGITKSMVGLANVDNTSDVNKLLSSARKPL